MDELFGVFDEPAAGAPAAAAAAGASSGPGARGAGSEGETATAKRVRADGTGGGDPVPLGGADDVEPAAQQEAAAGGGAGGGADGDAGDGDDDAGEQLQPAPDSKAVQYAAARPDDAPAAAAGGGAAEAAPAVANPGAAGLVRGDVDESKTTVLDDTLPETLAKTYPFELDPFQRRSIACLERNESVLVSAHTSAGKTVVAEYAIAMALRDKQRVIYTSPIKALSNQKYRDLYEEFHDVGLMTGDVTIAPNASCLVMTTEILRSMLYRGSEVLREVKWVIFDEIHYMRDRDRGVVWEESIVLLPDSVRFVFLSATIPNAKEFAEWVAHLHSQTCHVVYTEYRPTPLQHFVFPAGGESVFLVVDERGRFRADNYAKAMAQFSDGQLEDDVDAASGGRKRRRGKARRGAGPDDLYRVVKMIMERKYDPVIVFAFSKRECERNAVKIARLDLTTDEEKALIDRVFTSAVQGLSEDDRQLPQVQALLPLLRRGIGIHHGGLLPILKEVVEILFQESLVKILFATETFAMGVNMPAKTVIFTAVNKWDGTQTRLISAGEYIQMSGRAGRRGLDDRGIVIQLLESKLDPAEAKTIMRGVADPLTSAFHLSYNMLLNLMRVEEATVDPETMMAKSFHQFQNERNAPALEAELARLEAEMAGIAVPDEAAARAHLQAEAALAQAEAALRALVLQPRHVVPFLQPGRLVHVRDGGTDWGWGVVVGYERRGGAHEGRGGGARGMTGTRRGAGAGASAGAGAGAAAGGAAGEDEAPESVVVDVLLRCASNPAGAGAAARPEPCPPDIARKGGGEMLIVPVLLPLLAELSQIRGVLPPDLQPRAARAEFGGRLREMQARFPKGFPALDPIADMGIASPECEAAVRAVGEARAALADAPLAALPEADRASRLATLRGKIALDEQCEGIRRQLRATKTLVMRDTLRRMKRVLRRLGHVDADGVVQLKGRVACEVNAADELLLTEVIFNGLLNDLSPEQTAALVSCLIYTDRKVDPGDMPALSPALDALLRRLQDAARRIAEVTAEAGIPIDVDEYVQGFNPGIMELVHAWASGSKFADICGMTKEFEGGVIRVIRRLEELLRQLADGARAIGDESLEHKFKEASSRMRRGIVFAASLYL